MHIFYTLITDFQIGNPGLTLLRGDSEESRNFLFDFLAPTLRADHLPRLVFRKGHDPVERFLARFADEVVAWHEVSLAFGLSVLPIQKGHGPDKLIHLQRTHPPRLPPYVLITKSWLGRQRVAYYGLRATV